MNIFTVDHDMQMSFHLVLHGLNNFWVAMPETTGRNARYKIQVGFPRAVKNIGPFGMADFHGQGMRCGLGLVFKEIAFDPFFALV